MGNCLIIRNNQISAHDDDDSYEEQPRESEVEQKKITSGSSFESEESMKKKKKRIKKKVRFELQEDEERREGITRKSGAVRIRLVVTQEELKKILSHESDTQHTTLEELLSSVKSGGRSRICEVTGEDDGAMNAWRPTLESIPEDQ